MSAVVYAVTHKPKGLVYVGSTRDAVKREKRWRKRLALFCEDPTLPVEGLNFRFRYHGAGTLAAEWRFLVVRQLADDASEADLWAAEGELIELAMSRADVVCLNLAKGHRSFVDFRAWSDIRERARWSSDPVLSGRTRPWYRR